MKSLHKLLSLLLFFVVFVAVHAQQVNVSVTVLPPYSPVLSDYYSLEGRVLVLLQNTTGNSLNIKLGGTFTGDNGVEIRTRSSVQPASPIVLAPFENKRLTARELGEVFSERNLEFSGVNRDQVLRDRIIPEGMYQLCLRAFNFAGTGHSSPLSPELGGCSNPFSIRHLETPEILSIGGQAPGETLDPLTPQSLTIQWTIPPGAPAGTEYILTVVEIFPDDRSPDDAIRSTTSPVFLQRTTSAPVLLLGPADPLLEPGKRYAARVQAINRATGAYFRNSGYSPVVAFRYGASTGTSGISIDAVYPSGGDFIPFSYFPIIVKYRPYSNDYNRFYSTYRLFAGEARVDQHARELPWGFGPLESQRRATGFDITEEEAQHIAVNRNNSESPLPTYQRGVPYRWEADVRLTRFASTQRLEGQARADFRFGMSQPQPLSPDNNAEVAPGETSLRFQTARPPVNLFPPFMIAQARRSTGPQFFNGLVNEKWALEVSRYRDFRTVIDTATGTVGQGYDLNTADEASIRADLYKELSRNFTYTDTGEYFWRIKWLTDPRATDLSGAYSESETFRFRVTGSGAPVRDSIPPPRADCMGNCDEPAIPPAERRAVSTFAAGSAVSLGKFRLDITDITWSGTTARGRGTIPVPYFNAPMKVEFENLQVNAAGKVFAGVARGVVDEAGLIPPEMARAGGRLTGLTDERAETLNNFVSQSTRLVSAFTGSTPVGLPIGLDNVIEGQRYTIAIVGLNFTPERATLNAIFSIDIPELHGWLSLGASDICFHTGGLAGLGRAMLYNPTDRVFPFSSDVQMVLKATSLPADTGTFARWDCDGFQELRLKGEFIFSRDWFVPDSITGDPASGKVKARFVTSIRRKGNWFANLSFDRFQLASLPGWGFAVQDAVLDFSDLANSEGMIFPPDYRGEKTALWRGFYLKRMELRLPGEFKTFDDPTRRITISVNHVLIDRTGLSGSLRAENVVNIAQGNLDGWGFSIDTIHIDMVSNSFSRAGFNGGIKVPIGESPLSYAMILSRDTTANFAYEFRIQARDTLTASLWAANLELFPTSRISVIVDRHGFNARAELHGKISIAGDLGPLNSVDFRGMEFQELVVQSRAPYLSCRHFGFASPAHSAGGFPVNINGIELVTRDGPSMTESDRSPGPRAGIAFNLNLALTGESNTFRATTRIAILGKLNLGGGESQAWQYSGVSLDSIAIGGSVGVVEIDGALAFYSSHPTYGEGIKGYIRASFRPTITLSATAQFGSVDGYRYWYVDAMAEFNPGITVFAGLAVNGFGGAAYYKMRMTNPPPFERIGSTSSPASDSPGASLTQTTYTPNRASGFGFEAKLLLGAPGGGSAYKALVTFGANFNTSGGINQMYLNGDLFVMSESTRPGDAPVYGALRVSYDFAENILDGRFELYVNVAGGALRGIGSDNKAGWMHLYCSPSKWFFKIGEPDNRVGLRVASLFESGSYFMIGMDLPGMPPLPEKIASVLSINNQRDPRLATGDGFAFGTYVSFNTGRLPFLMFYARFGLDLGFDLSVMNYGNVTCEGMPPGSRIGADGWYAQGQLYAYFEGSIGIFVDLWFVSGEFEILGIRAAAALRGGFPNPSWMIGNVGGRYSILGGAIKGQCNFEAKLGERCSPPVENPLADLEIITQMIPEHNTTGVDCGVEPQAVFNITPDREFSVTVINDDGQERIRHFRVKHRNYNLKRGTANLAGRTTRSADTLLLTFTPNEYLEPFQWHNHSVEAFVEEWFVPNSWRISRRLDNSEIRKTYSANFQTGAYPDRIRPSDVLYSYPFHNQRYFLQDECRVGVLQLKGGMSRLFAQEAPQGWTWKYYAEFVPILLADQPENPILSELRVSGAHISFDIPSLQNDKVYATRFVARQERVATTGPRVAGTIDISSRMQLQPDVSMQFRTLTDLRTGSSVQVRSNRVDATRTRPGEKLMYVWYYRTSRFNRLSDKVNTLSTAEAKYANLGHLENFTLSLNHQEPFDVFDVQGFRYTSAGREVVISPLVYQGADWNANWHNRFTQPYIYNLHKSLRDERLTTAQWTRRPLPHGIPPVWAVEFASNNYTRGALQSHEFLPQEPRSEGSSTTGLSIPSTTAFAGMALPTANIQVMSFTRLVYNSGVLVPLDFQRIKTIAGQVVAIYGLNNSEFLPEYLKPPLRRVLYQNYSRMYRGTYKVNFYYRPPWHCLDPDAFDKIPSGFINFTY